MKNEFLLSEIPDKKEIDAFIHPLLLMLETYIEKQPNLNVGENESDLYTLVLQYITANHNTRITMKDLSDKFNYSISSLSHLFKRRSGMSINEYVEKLRLDEAKWLLKQSDLSVTEISDNPGFCNSAYFSSVFKRKYGIPPKDYAKSR